MSTSGTISGNPVDSDRLLHPAYGAGVITVSLVQGSATLGGDACVAAEFAAGIQRCQENLRKAGAGCDA